MSSTILSYLLLLIICCNPYLTVGVAGAGENPFMPKGYLLRYWNKQISNNLPKPDFLLDKASPLTAAQYAAFSKLANDPNSLSIHLPEFCSKANLLCFPDLTPSLEKHSTDVNFKTYTDQNFTNYEQTPFKSNSQNSFQSYNEDNNVIVNTFRSYGHGSNGHKDNFNTYATESNVVDQSFNSYGIHAQDEEGEFNNYNTEVNVPNIRFSSYSEIANGGGQKFNEYTTNANSGDQRFTSYGKTGNGVVNEFTSYGKRSNVMGLSFNHYGENGNGANETFTSYGNDGNVPENNFSNYGTDGNVPVENFRNYRDESNVGDDNFQSYGKHSNAGKAGFENYGQSFNEGTDKFSGYEDAIAANFKIYGVNNTFKEYTKEFTNERVTFSSYINKSSSIGSSLVSMDKMGANKWAVEPGKFFREEMLKSGTIMPMPDIHDKMPKRSFLPRLIVSKLPFSTLKLGEMKKIFHVAEDSSMAKMFTDALTDCERVPSPGETKQCPASIEDMIDFTTSVLGRNVVVRTTENTQGSEGNIMIGQVKGINGGKVTKSVSCHQSLFPYLLYYCHSVPKVRVYEVDILDPKSKTKINQGVAICHLDTSTWSPGHGAFIALGSSPGKIEVCHWIFENDMTWTISD